MEQRDFQGPNGSSVQVFIIRIWTEARATPELPRALRGVIEHLPSGQKRYFTSMTEMLTFLNGELKHAGLLLRERPKIHEWLWQRLRQFLL